MTHITDNNNKPARFNGNTSDWISPVISVYEIISDINASTLDLEAELISGGIVGDQYIAQIEVTELIAGTFTEGTATIYTTDDRVSITEIRSFTTGDCYSERNLGLKYYELSNHPNTFGFGNVMEVITDRKITVDDATFDALTGDLVTMTSDGVIDYFSADIVQYSDYYPYGMTMPGRNGSVSEKYRYAFNGMETDQEVSGSGNSYTTQFRQYDPRLGRWKSLDPLAAQFPWQSPFNGMDDNPISMTDFFGLAASKKGEPKDGGESSKRKIKWRWGKDKDGNRVGLGGDGELDKVEINANGLPWHKVLINRIKHKVVPKIKKYIAKKRDELNAMEPSSPPIPEGTDVWLKVTKDGVAVVGVGQMAAEYGMGETYVKAKIGKPYKIVKGYRFLKYQSKAGNWINAYAVSTGELRKGSWTKSVKSAKKGAIRKLVGRTVLGVTIAIEVYDGVVGNQSMLETGVNIGKNGLLAVPGANLWMIMDMAGNIYWNNLTLDEQMKTFYDFKINPNKVIHMYDFDFEDGPVNWCFVEGTSVLSVNEFINIEDLGIGDSVYTFNFVSKELELSQVTSNYMRVSDTIINLCFSNYCIKVTPEHPFYCVNRSEWVTAASITIADVLLTADGDLISIEDSFYEYQTYKVYNLTLDGNHNYFVSSYKILVHNKD